MPSLPHHDKAAFAILHGRWNVLRRRSAHDPGVARIAFGPRGALAVTAPDGVTVSRGHWEAPSHGDAPPTLHLLVGAREHVFESVVAGSPPGTVHLGRGAERWELARARPIAASVVGTWLRATEVSHGRRPGVSLHLRPDGAFSWHHAEGAAPRVGSWWVEPSTTPGVQPLTLDPAEFSSPLSAWTFDARARLGHPVELREDGVPDVTWVRAGADPFAHRFEGRWRRFAPVGGELPLELALLSEGDVELLVHPSAPRWMGRWWIGHVRRDGTGVEATLTVVANAPGRAPVRDVSHVRLGFAPGAPLEFLRDGARVVAFRRLFR